jgi:quercetin dioxygenase-like cupin family protein
MKYLRIYSGPDGESHFADVEVPGNPVGHASQSDPFTATGVIFRHAPDPDFHDWHNAPRRQFVVHLTGDTEVQTSDGEVRQIPAGSVVLAEDVTGKGHTTRGLTGDRLMLFVPLPQA